MRLILQHILALVQVPLSQKHHRLVTRQCLAYCIVVQAASHQGAYSTTNTVVNDQDLTILQQTDKYVVVSKPPSVVCHHSGWTGSRSRNEVPILQRTRDATGRRVNLIHRLDRGCSGCLLMAFADDDNDEEYSANVASQLSQAMRDPNSTKTYLALVRGEGILNGRDFRQEGWFKVDRPIKDEGGNLNDATTWFRFIVGQDNARGTIDRPRTSLVMARPETGRWHQIRRHLNGLSHPILGDSSHGNSKVNQEWRLKRGMLPERTCLHLSRIQIGPTPSCPNGVDVSCPLAQDLMRMLQLHLPILLENAKPILEEEGITL